MADNMPLVARIMVQHGGGGPPSGPGVGGAKDATAPEEKSRWKKTQKRLDEISKGTRSHIAKTLGIQVGIASILKQSQVFTGYIGTIFQLMGALVDVILAPFLPIIVPAIKLLASFIPIARDLMKTTVAKLVWGFNWVKEKFDEWGWTIGKLPDRFTKGFKTVLTAVLIGVFFARLSGMWKLAQRLLSSNSRLTAQATQGTYNSVRALVTSAAGLKPTYKALEWMARKATRRMSIYTHDVRNVAATRMNGLKTAGAVTATGAVSGGFLGKLVTGGRLGRSLMGKFFGSGLMKFAAMMVVFQLISSLIFRGNKEVTDAVHEGSGLIRAGTKLDANAQLALGKRQVGILGQIEENTKNMIEAIKGAWDQIRMGLAGWINDLVKRLLPVDVPKVKVTPPVDVPQVKVTPPVDVPKVIVPPPVDVPKVIVPPPVVRTPVWVAEIEEKLDKVDIPSKAKATSTVKKPMKFLPPEWTSPPPKRSGGLKFTPAVDVPKVKVPPAVTAADDVAKAVKIASTKNAPNVAKSMSNLYHNLFDPYLDVIDDFKKKGPAKALKNIGTHIVDALNPVKVGQNIAKSLTSTGGFKGIAFDRMIENTFKLPTELVGPGNVFTKNMQKVVDFVEPVTKQIPKITMEIAKQADKLKVVTPVVKNLAKVAVHGARLVPFLATPVEAAYGVYQTQKSYKEYGKDKAIASAVAGTVATAVTAVDPTGIVSAVVSGALHGAVALASKFGFFGKKNEPTPKPPPVPSWIKPTMSPAHPLYKAAPTSYLSDAISMTSSMSPGHPANKPTPVNVTVNVSAGNPHDNPMQQMTKKVQSTNNATVTANAFYDDYDDEWDDYHW